MDRLTPADLRKLADIMDANGFKLIDVGGYARVYTGPYPQGERMLFLESPVPDYDFKRKNEDDENA